MYRKERYVLSALVAAWVVMVSGCGAEPVGSVQIVGKLAESASASDVTRVSVTLTAADLEPRTLDLVKGNDEWSGKLERVPVDQTCTFTTEGFGTDGTKLYAGTTTNLSLREGEVFQILITLRPLVSGP